MRQYHNPAARGGLAALIAAMAAFASLTPAHAALGGGGASVEADRAELAATLVSTTYATYTIYTLTQPNGGTVREFANASGEVFAVTWRGPGHADLRQLLAGYFSALQTDTAARSGRRRRAPMTVDRADVVVRAGGHPGAFRGVAYLPQQAPAGFTSQDLRQD